MEWLRPGARLNYLANSMGIVVKRLPKTRSGKIVRGTMKKIADGQKYAIPATIDDPATLDEIAEALGTVGYPRELVKSE